jgi:hypothetical protein
MPLPEGRKPLDNNWFHSHLTDLSHVNRVEVIDDNGRSYTEYKAKEVQLSIQDNGETLKIFLKNGQENE